jgi:hypothetical protein
MSPTVIDIKNAIEGAGLKFSDDFYMGGGGLWEPLGLIEHHDAGGLSYIDNWDGQDDTAIAEHMANPENLGAQLWVGRSGTWYCLSDGRKGHAGLGVGWQAIPPDSGNTYACGVEVDYGPVRPGWTGPTLYENGYTWPVWDMQHKASVWIGSAALTKAFGWQAPCGHKEYAPARKIDPAGYSMAELRGFVVGWTPSNVTPKPPEEEVTQDDINAIADKVIEKLEKKLFRSNFVEKDEKGANTIEKARDKNIFDTLGSTNTNTTRVFLGKSL